jgi:phosphoribosylformylglycinamidine synthase I
MMGKVKTIVLRAPGTNCDLETAFAFQLAGAETEPVHIGQVIRGEKRLINYQIMVIPGGFAYGDDLGAGMVEANEMRLKLASDIERFVTAGCLILGICNGFQALVKAGILPGGACNKRLTLTNNDSGRFECRWVHLAANPQSHCVFTRGIERLYLPVAHGEGKIVADADIIDGLDAPLYYTDESGNRGAGYPYNPNGSMNDIAGLCDATGRIFALMPHPERHVRTSQHPSWTRSSSDGDGPGDGLKIFKNAVDWAKGL